MSKQANLKLMEEDQRSVSLSWENFNVGMQEFLVACRFGEWKRAESKREEMLANAEAALDGLARLYRRQENLDK